MTPWTFRDSGGSLLEVEYEDGMVCIAVGWPSGTFAAMTIPYQEFQHLARVMKELSHEKLPPGNWNKDAVLFRTVMALGGLEWSDMERFLGCSQMTVIRLLAGQRMTSPQREFLVKAKALLEGLDYDPHLGRRDGVMRNRDGNNLYGELWAMKPRRDEPIQGPGYTTDQLLGVHYDTEYDND